MNSHVSEPLSQGRAELVETSLFGIRLFGGSFTAAVNAIMRDAAARSGGIVCVANVDMVTRALSMPGLAGAMAKARWVVTDGMPLVWALKHLNGMAFAERVNGPRLTLELCRRAAAEGVSVFLYGGTPQELELMRANLLAQFPELKIAGAVSPPMLPAEPPFDAEITEQINQSGAGLVFVGLGCPKQESWMLAQQPHLKPIALGVGFAFALIAGTKSHAPQWMQRNGLEWLFRLSQEPGRLWKRYLVGNSIFIAQVLKHLVTRRR
ncbi:WecB/TagA/CpsF family glycosyltransferase [Paucibacter sediminis]|uniref:WecB/TagA/CpsF family glycosyltransferase n=1 Tax=Paucibacter sediminis TaxID=3019553 RepID=A0AA95N9T6_9BURK|nr:WecB/TagA/CpsF family glycosyltransferase [Paucibacter sp. S2-9]WIT10060.1 WecB/TagA/CpsF family glycosyltransferase [Paucibacter sp. S2-9]